MVSPYLPHILSSLALCSISINLVSRKKIIEDERARVAAQTSILESIREQLLDPKRSLSGEELERLRGLARSSSGGVGGGLGGVGEGKGEGEGMGKEKEKETISWSDVFTGRGPSKDEELSKWDQKDLEILRKELSK